MINSKGYVGACASHKQDDEQHHRQVTALREAVELLNALVNINDGPPLKNVGGSISLDEVCVYCSGLVHGPKVPDCPWTRALSWLSAFRGEG